MQGMLVTARGAVHRASVDTPKRGRDFEVGEVDTETSELVPKLFKWTTTASHSAYFMVPRDFDEDDYDMSEALAEHDDDGFDGLERDLDEVLDVERVPDKEIPVLDLDGFEES